MKRPNRTEQIWKDQTVLNSLTNTSAVLLVLSTGISGASTLTANPNIVTSPEIYNGAEEIEFRVPEEGIWPSHFSGTEEKTNFSTEILKKILGEYSASRVELFKTYIKGWDGQNAEPLNRDSLRNLHYFLSKFSSFETEPSLFLTPLGNVQLEWEDTEGYSIDLEFLPNEIEFFLERYNSESTVPLNEKRIEQFITKLS